MAKLLFLCCFLLAVFANCEIKEENFDFFLFAQDWPIVVCQKAVEEGSHCVDHIPTNSWLIHGLWPTILHTEEPAYCNDSAKFNETLIKDLLPEMEKYWTNLYNGTELDRFWVHEWEKHGTCATSVPETGNEHQYFSKVLSLFKQINITGVMERLGYFPDDNNPLDVYDLASKLKNVYGGIEPIVTCYKYKETYYLFSIEICFNKSFGIIDCVEGTNKLYFKSFENSRTTDSHVLECSESGKVIYPKTKESFLYH